jgi:hypothetical protein
MPVSIRKAKRIPDVKTNVSFQLCTCMYMNPPIKNRIKAYTSHFNGSLIGRLSWKDNRRVFRGEIFLIETRGNNANKTDMIIPMAIPCQIAFQERGVAILTGRKSSRTLGRYCWMNVPRTAPITVPNNPIPTI